MFEPGEAGPSTAQLDPDLLEYVRPFTEQKKRDLAEVEAELGILQELSPEEALSFKRFQHLDPADHQLASFYRRLHGLTVEESVVLVGWHVMRFSGPQIAEWSGLHERTVRRRLATLRKVLVRVETITDQPFTVDLFDLCQRRRSCFRKPMRKRKRIVL